MHLSMVLFCSKEKNCRKCFIGWRNGFDFKKIRYFNIFEKIYKAEQRNEPLINKTFSMSDECRTGVKLLELESFRDSIYMNEK